MRKPKIGQLIESVTYITLLMFFTYTFLAVECLKDTACVYDAYLQNQATVFALVTNFGLYFMLLIDYMSGKSYFKPWVIFTMALLILVDVLIYCDACVLADPSKYESFGNLRSLPYLFAYLHIGTVLFLIFMKYKSLEEVTAASAV